MKKYYMCHVSGRGNPEVIHATFSEAHKEAMRLARKERTNVYILQTIGLCKLANQPVEYVPINDPA